MAVGAQSACSQLILFNSLCWKNKKTQQPVNQWQLNLPIGRKQGETFAKAMDYVSGLVAGWIIYISSEGIFYKIVHKALGDFL